MRRMRALLTCTPVMWPEARAVAIVVLAVVRDAARRLQQPAPVCKADWQLAATSARASVRQLTRSARGHRRRACPWRARAARGPSEVATKPCDLVGCILLHMGDAAPPAAAATAAAAEASAGTAPELEEEMFIKARARACVRVCAQRAARHAAWRPTGRARRALRLRCRGAHRHTHPGC